MYAAVYGTRPLPSARQGHQAERASVPLKGSSWLSKREFHVTDDTRRYSDAETRELLRIAASTEHLTRAERGAVGLTLPEIRAIASEVGIQPSRVDLAAQALEKPAITNSVLGFGVTYQQEFSVPTRLTDAQIHAIADEADRSIGGVGEVSQNLHAMEWHNAKRFAFIGVARTATATRVRVITDHGYELLASAGLTIMVARFAYVNVVDVASIPEVGLGILVGGAAVGTLHVYWKWRARRLAARIRRLSTRLQGVISLPHSDGDRVG